MLNTYALIRQIRSNMIYWNFIDPSEDVGSVQQQNRRGTEEWQARWKTECGTVSVLENPGFNGIETGENTNS